MMKGSRRKARATRGRGAPTARSSMRTRASNAFRIDPSFFGRVIESLAEYAVLTMDRDLNLTSANAAAQRIFGYGAEELKGKPVARIFTPEDRKNGFPEREFDEAHEKGRAEDERYHLAKDGRRFWSYGLSFPLTDGAATVQGYVKIVRDESERKQKEDLLLEQQERLRLAVEATGMGTWDYFPSTETLELSDSALELLDIPPGSHPTYESFLSRVHPEDRRTVDSAVHACLDSTNPACDVEHRVVLPDGSTRWITLKAKVLVVHCPDGKEKCPRLSGLVMDSTERKDRMTRLQLANEELESFTYSASHDLRAPLRRISFYSQLVQESQHALLDEKGKDCFKRIQTAAGHMNSLIEALLNLSLATRNAMSLEMVDLSELADGIVEDLRRSDPGRACRIDIQPGLSTKGDRQLLSAALRNLLDNAWKYTQQRPKALIAFGAKDTPEGRVYFVRDNGAGFDMQNSGRLFKPFQRLHSATEFPGTGVGLGIVHRVIRRHRGRVWAESAPDRGATFFFTLFSEAGDRPAAARVR